MSRILLISANTNIEPMPVYPLGIALIDAALKHQGHKTRQFDLLYDRQRDVFSLAKTITSFVPDIVGISVRNIDDVDSLSPGNNWYLAGLKKLVDRIRHICNVPVVLGGPAFSIMPEIILDYCQADFGVVGEGETAFNNLIEMITRGENPPKITGPLLRPMGPKDFCSPSWDKALVDYYIDRSGMVNYQTKRGCPFGCNYCSYPLIEGKIFRYQDPEFVADNLERLKTDFSVNSFFFTDSIFNDPNGHYLEVAEALVRKNLGMRWAAYFRPDIIAQDDLALLKRSGLYAMEVGSDAACDTTLAGINKAFEFSRIITCNESCRKAEIPCAHFFMFGGPGENADTINESLANIAMLRQTVVFAFSGIRILPKTGIANIARKQGIIDAKDSLLKPRYYISPDVDKGTMDQQIETAFFRKKDRFFPPKMGQMRMKALQAFGFKGLLWDMILKTTPKRNRNNKKTFFDFNAENIQVNHNAIK
ncbi:MAG: cobalamin-dependent protein [Desulfobacteraceae bacterium]|nr:cobalamin-dependent protein [Desulfobacteraceae bacterium]